MHGSFAPLNTLSARIKIAVGLGLISDPEYRDCEALRKIRNEFAHNIKVSFNDQRIKDLSKNLRFFGDTYMNRKITVEGVFRLSAGVLMESLINRMFAASQLQLQTQSWLPERKRGIRRKVTP